MHQHFRSPAMGIFFMPVQKILPRAPKGRRMALIQSEGKEKTIRSHDETSIIAFDLNEEMVKS